MVACDRTAALYEHVNLPSQPPGAAPIVVIPVANNLADGLTATKVSLLSDVALLGKVNQSDSAIVWNEIPYVLAVREDQKLRPKICLLLETLNRFWKPRPPVPR